MRLQGKTALITDGSGIGLATARLFAAEGKPRGSCGRGGPRAISLCWRAASRKVWNGASWARGGLLLRKGGRFKAD